VQLPEGDVEAFQVSINGYRPYPKTKNETADSDSNVSPDRMNFSMIYNFNYNTSLSFL
jgi:hypothetical protein